MFRSDQTRYHREWVGFSKTVTLGNIAPLEPGIITAFSPRDSLQFLNRFRDWRAYRMIGWTCTVIPKTGMTGDGYREGVIAFAAYNQSLLGTTSFTAPNSLESLLELPNAKTLPISANNPRSKATFSWFNRRGDINALPFQSVEALDIAEYTTGLLGFANVAGNNPLEYEVYGKLQLEFKDKNIFLAAPPPPADDFELMDQPVNNVVKRLNRTILHN
jgi:hypothetical protein